MPDEDVLGQGAPGQDAPPSIDQDHPDAGAGTEESPFFTLAEIGAEIDRRLGPAVEAALRRNLDQHFRGTQAQVDRLATQINKEIGGTRETLSTIHAYLEEGTAQELRDHIKEKVRVSGLERQLEEAKTQPVPETQPGQSADQIAKSQGDFFWSMIWPDIMDTGADAKLTEAELMNQVFPATPLKVDYGDPRAIQEWKRQARAIVWKVAGEKQKAAAASRTTIRPDRTNGGGARPVSWDQAQKITNVDDLTDEAFQEILKAREAATVRR